MKYEYECSSFLRFTLKIAVVLGMFKKTINEKSSIKQKPFNYKGLTKSKICNLDIYSCYDNKDEVIIYLHGGGYLLGLDNMHIGFARKLQNKSKATVHIIDYPLAPVHKVDEVISEVYKTIREIVSTNINSNHHLIGDSAGGGMVLSLLKRLTKEEVSIKNTYLLSPWLDVSMTNEDVVKYQDVDYILKLEDLINCGNLYTNNNPKHLDASPIYDDYSNYNNITIFASEHDLLYPDMIKFYNMNPQTSIHIYKRAPHDFMLFPYTKEQKEVIKIISESIDK